MARALVLDFLVDVVNQARTQGAGGNQQLLVGGLGGVAGKLVEEAGDVLTDLRVAGDETEILVEAGGGGVVVTGADVTVAAQPVRLFTQWVFRPTMP